MAEKNMNAKISVEFEETANRQQLSSGDNLPTLFGKIKKFFTDLKPVALSGSYNDLDDTLIAGEGITINEDKVISAIGQSTAGKVMSYTYTKENGEDETVEVIGIDGDEIFNCDYNVAASQAYGATARGRKTVAHGNNASAEGRYTRAIGDTAHAEGASTRALGSYSHAEGSGTLASGTSSHAEGDDNKATGFCSHAEGQFSIASGDFSHAEGSSVASSYYSHAEGGGSEASGMYSHVEGYGTRANAKYQHVQGKYNIADTEEKYAHIVGNGTAEDEVDDEGNITTQKRSNAHTLDWDGNAWYAGSVVGNNIIGKNLVDNSDFYFNSRGKNSYTGTGYCLDRWKITYTGFTVTKTSQGISITPENEVTGNSNVLSQLIPITSNMWGLPLTFSTNILVANQYAAINIFAQKADGTRIEMAVKTTLTEGITTTTLTTIPDETEVIRIVYVFNTGATTTDSISIEWAKLEVGTAATSFVSPNHAEELLKIQAMNDDGIAKLPISPSASLLNSEMISNLNLLDNGDLSINQRGQTEYLASVTSNGYTVDRWMQYPSYCIVTPLENGGAKISYNGETLPYGAYVRIVQALSCPLTVGETYTVQVSINGTIYCSTFTATEDYLDHNFGENNEYKVYTRASSVIIQLNSGQSMTVDWVKLELGSVATPFVKLNPAVELAKCQMWYIPAPLVGLPISTGVNNMFFFIPLPVTMRTTPSLSNTIVTMISRTTNAPVDITDWYLQIVNYKTNGLLVSMRKDNHGLDVKDYIIEITDGGISAEL